MTFSGFKRKDGSVGVRNHVLVVASVSCANGVAEAIGRSVPKAVVITHPYGCGYVSEDFKISFRVLSGLINNPNVGAALIIGLGCESLTAEHLARSVRDKPSDFLVIQNCGGSIGATEKGIKIVNAFLNELGQQNRDEALANTLTVGLECGGSDAFSGISANPAVGFAADLLVKEGARVILSETTEMIGTAHILKRRCATPELGDRVQCLINHQEQRVREILGAAAGMVIAPGNIEGGLSSITEKSLGCITKAGTTRINQVVEYAVRPTASGLVIMDTPGYDIDSMAGMAAGGAQIIIFTTGRGSIAGFPAIPVIKVVSNTGTYMRMSGDMDLNAGGIIDGDETIEAVGRKIYENCMKVASGKTTRAEMNGTAVFNYLKQGPTF
jgi:altronate dehydratase large subunit